MHRFAFPLKIAASVALFSLVAACSDAESSGAAQPAPPPPAVSVVEVAPAPIPILNELPGRIAPTRIAEVRPRVSGIIIERVFEQGSYVEQGDVLYRIDPAPFRVQVASAPSARSMRAVGSRSMNSSRSAQANSVLSRASVRFA